ncbi:histone H4 [Tanacetum coccineum]
MILVVEAVLGSDGSGEAWETNMKKGIHPQMQWISYVTQSGRLMQVMMTKIHQAGKVYHFRARRQMAESVGQVAKFKRRYGQVEEEKEDETK